MPNVAFIVEDGSEAPRLAVLTAPATARLSRSPIRRHPRAPRRTPSAPTPRPR